MTPPPRSKFSLGLAAAAVLLTETAALAGGMTLPVRGVRTLSRGGAFVAGADDADALWLDPAGLAHLAGAGKHALLFDAAFVYQTVDHAGVEADGSPAAPVSNEQPGQAVPTLAAALAIDDRLVIAGGLTSPYAGVHRYPAGGSQRYASVSSEGSRYVLLTAGLAYKVDDRLRIGVTVQNLVSQLRPRLVVSGCPGATTCAPDDRSFDATLALEQDDFFAPSGSAGLQYDVHPTLTLGLALQAPVRVSGSGTLAVDLPTSPLFDNATVVGDRGRLAFTLPPVLRAGVEWRPGERWRIEAALGVELWSLHDEVELVPEDVSVENVAGQTLALQAMTIPRAYGTSYAPALGVEWHGPRVALAAGYSYESAAAPAGDVSVLTVDAAKHLVGIGGGYEAEGWQIGAAAGFVALSRVDVSASEAAVPQQAPLADAPATRTINAGSYESRYVIAGLRFARRW